MHHDRSLVFAQPPGSAGEASPTDRIYSATMPACISLPRRAHAYVPEAQPSLCERKRARYSISSIDEILYHATKQGSAIALGRMRIRGYNDENALKA